MPVAEPLAGYLGANIKPSLKTLCTLAKKAEAAILQGNQAYQILREYCRALLFITYPKQCRIVKKGEHTQIIVNPHDCVYCQLPIHYFQSFTAVSPLKAIHPYTG
jgi:hypothetical protein